MSVLCPQPPGKCPRKRPGRLAAVAQPPAGSPAAWGHWLTGRSPQACRCGCWSPGGACRSSRSSTARTTSRRSTASRPPWTPWSPATSWCVGPTRPGPPRLPHLGTGRSFPGRGRHLGPGTQAPALNHVRDRASPPLAILSSRCKRLRRRQARGRVPPAHAPSPASCPLRAGPAADQPLPRGLPAAAQRRLPLPGGPGDGPRPRR